VKIVLLVAMMIATATVQAQEIRSCREVGVGIESLVTHVADNVQSFYNNRVQIYNIDTIEPAAASAGIAIVLPDTDDPLGGSKCFAITNFAGIDIKTSRAVYDPAKGLTVSIPTKSPDFQTGKSRRGPLLNIVINLQHSSVTIIQGAKADKTDDSDTARPDDFILSVKTRFGDVVVSRDPNSSCNCTGWIQFRSTKIEIRSSGSLSAKHQNTFRMKEGDVLVISVDSAVRGMSPQYYVLLVQESGIFDVSNERFPSLDGTFRAEQHGDEIRFDLGFVHGKHKRAFFRNGVLYVGFDAVARNATVPRDRCVEVLNKVVECGDIARKQQAHDCASDAIEMPMSVTRFLGDASNLPIFTVENFYKVCSEICRSGKYESQSSRKILCGY